MLGRPPAPRRRFGLRVGWWWWGGRAAAPGQLDAWPSISARRTLDGSVGSVGCMAQHELHHLLLRRFGVLKHRVQRRHARFERVDACQPGKERQIADGCKQVWKLPV